LRDAMGTDPDVLGLFVAARRSELDGAFFAHVAGEIEALEAPPPSRGKAERGAKLFGLRRQLLQLCEAHDFMAGSTGVDGGEAAGRRIPGGEVAGRAFDAGDAEAVGRFKEALEARERDAPRAGGAEGQGEGPFPPREAAAKLEAMRAGVPSSFAPSNEERVLAFLVDIADDVERGEALEQALQVAAPPPLSPSSSLDGAGATAEDVDEVSCSPMRLLVECERAVHRQELAHAVGTPFEVLPMALPAPGVVREDLTLVRLRWVRDALKTRAGFQ